MIMPSRVPAPHSSHQPPAVCHALRCRRFLQELLLADKNDLPERELSALEEILKYEVIKDAAKDSSLKVGGCTQPRRRLAWEQLRAWSAADARPTVHEGAGAADCMCSSRNANVC